MSCFVSLLSTIWFYLIRSSTQINFCVPVVCIIISQVISKWCFIESAICNFSKISLLSLFISRCWFRKLHLNVVCIDLLLSVWASGAMIILCILFRPSGVAWFKAITVFNLIGWTNLTIWDFVGFYWLRLMGFIVIGLIYIVGVLSLLYFFIWFLIWVLTCPHCCWTSKKVWIFYFL